MRQIDTRHGAGFVPHIIRAVDLSARMRLPWKISQNLYAMASVRMIGLPKLSSLTRTSRPGLKRIVEPIAPFVVEAKA